MRRRDLPRALSAVTAAALLTAGCGGPGTEEARRAPELSGRDLDDEPRDIADLAGEVILVNAWASWCAPCREEMPVLAAAQESLGHAGLRVLGLNVRDRPTAAERLVAETGVQFPSITDADGMIAVGWGVRGMPQTFLVDRDGYIADHRFGAVDQEWIDSIVAPLVLQEEGS